jgi:hypothetical protein
MGGSVVAIHFQGGSERMAKIKRARNYESRLGQGVIVELLSVHQNSLRVRMDVMAGRLLTGEIYDFVVLETGLMS